MTDLIWQIGSPEGPSPDLANNYREPAGQDPVRWDAGRTAGGAQRWPMFQASEADPDGGYRLHPLEITFDLRTLAPAYRLQVHYLTIAPRLGHLEIDVNGTAGSLYVSPRPSTSGEIILQAGLHTALYAEGTASVVLPSGLLNGGANRLTLTCRDGAPVTRFANPEKIKRLDRMATGAGLIYRCLELLALDTAPGEAVEQVTVEPTVLYRRGADGTLYERCWLEAALTGPLAAARWALKLSGKDLECTLPLELPAAAFGHVRAPFELPDGSDPIAYCLSGRAGGAMISPRGTLRRRRKWQVYVAPHVHTDIGYTHRQSEVAERLARNLDAALEMTEQLNQPGQPPAFAYHLDSAWTLDHYLATRTEARRAALLAAVRARHIGLPGNYVILLSQFAALEDLVRNAELAAALSRPAGHRPHFAAVVDVPSLSQAVPDIMAGTGQRFLVHASNQDRGPFRLHGGLHRRSPYYWQGPAGGRVLVWLSKMYCELRKVCGSPPEVATAERGLPLWLEEYDRPDYVPDAVLLYGQEADNTDLDPQPAEFIQAWNTAYAYPRLIPCVPEQFFEYVEAGFGGQLACLPGDGGAYWEDGVGSTLTATTAGRRAQAALPAAERLAGLAALHQPEAAFPHGEFDAAWRSLLQFDEHTWGAFLSGSDPEARLQRDQWAAKAHLAESAAQAAGSLLHAAATRHSLQWNAEGREVAVYNPHSWTASGAVLVEVGRREVVVDPVTGAPVPQRRVRTLATQAWVEFWVDALGGLSYRRYRLLEEPGEPANPARASRRQPVPLVLENARYRLVIDPARGCVTRWVDRALMRDLTSSDDAWGFGQVLYAAGGEGSRLLSNRADLPEGRPEVHGQFALAEYGSASDALGERAWLHGETAAGQVEIEWSLPARAPEMELQITLRKPERLEPEAVYVAFPLALPGATVQSDSQLGWVDWNAGRLPGACQEWLPLQSAILMTQPGASVCLASPDIPLFCVGDIVRGRWPKDSDLSGGRIFSYVLNNYWRTNYQAAQGGEFVFRYRLTSGRSITPDAAYRFGGLARQPLLAQRLSLQEFRQPRPPYDQAAGGILAQVAPEQVALTTFKAARWVPGWIARLQELAGAARLARLQLAGRRIARAWNTDLLENDLEPLPVEGDGALRVAVPAWGLRTVRLEVSQ